ncbi:DUF2332 domain-containing protein [Gordonia sp. PKS22-38]|uniref:DUF2332 domain-containing protein n=1 Tax=Gordonia prachuapensis TaxID=3115651 RepID=A0ABU7MW20_9ACTN|nr:DUF2332 domain-containing protein [Gordonia sp. PKS22-38]
MPRRSEIDRLRRHGEAMAVSSPMCARIAYALSESADALRVIRAVPTGHRDPRSIIAVLHYLALTGRAAELAAAIDTDDPDAAAVAAVQMMHRHADVVVATAAHRTHQTMRTAVCAVLYPALADAAHRLGADDIGVIDVNPGAGLNVHTDRVAITYSTGESLGDSSSRVSIDCRVVGQHAIPTRSLPRVVARVGIGTDIVDLADPDDVLWLRACGPPDQDEPADQLDAAVGVAAAQPPVLLRGDVLDVVDDAIDKVPAGALPLVTTTWALSALPLESRLRWLQRLGDIAARRPIAWISVEGVGVSPSIPTMGDRRASGHSIVGLTVLGSSDLHSQAVGRCWSRGRVMSWLNASPESGIP